MRGDKAVFGEAMNSQSCLSKLDRGDEINEIQDTVQVLFCVPIVSDKLMTRTVSAASAGQSTPTGQPDCWL
jgi:hypothetical protein